MIVELIPEKLQREVDPIFAPMLAASAEMMAAFSDQELATIAEFVNRSVPILREETARLRREGAAARRPNHTDGQAPARRGRRGRSA